MVTKRILTLVVMAIMVLSVAVVLAGCTFNLEKYKEEAQAEIDSYAQANYREETWTEIQNIVAKDKRTINDATNKSQIDSIVVAAKKAIDKVEAERIKPMGGAEEYAGGNGTESTPYIISTKGQLIHFSNQINSGINTSAYFVLGADVDLEGIEWMPIGIVFYKSFDGFFDGKGYEVSNFCITVRQKNTSAENIGLFGYNEGTIRNLGVVNFSIDITWAYEFGYGWSIMTGGLAGSNFGDITSCFVIGEINLEYNGGATINAPSHIYAGGLVGYNEGKLTCCYSTVDVNAIYNDEAGDVHAAGLAIGGVIDNCFVTGNVNAKRYPDGSYSGDCDVFSISKYLRVGDHILNSYAYDGQVIDINISSEESCTEEELNTSDFYVNKLGWSTNIWDFESLDFSKGKYLENKYPRLKVNN